VNTIEAIILGIVQGLTEFLPVSSSGHLVMAQSLDAWRYIGKLAVATLPAIGIALTLRGFIEQQFGTPWVAGVMLLVTGCIVWTTRSTITKGTAEEPTWMQALIIGCAQAFAILPGITRSGTTLATAMALGMAPLAAAEFSFLMGVIAMAGAAVLLLPELTSASPELMASIWAGGAAALISGLLALVLVCALGLAELFPAELPNNGFKNRPVCDPRVLATSSGVPVAIICPPPAPPSGPRSTTQSAVLITSRLCSITTTVFP